MSRNIALYIVDVLFAIFKIERYTENFSDSESFYSNDLYWDATLRELQIIGDASKKMITMNFLTNDFRMIVDFRNLIAHAYFGIDYEMVWDIIRNELKPFYNEIIKRIKKQNVGIKEAVRYLIKEQEKANRRENLSFLNKLLKQF